jgi:hypothetical protein
MPHTKGKRYAVVSCHVEQPLDDRAWRLFTDFQRRRPGGFGIAALLRAPHEGEDRSLWLDRARAAAAQGPLGHHTHWTSPTHARPTDGDPAKRVRDEAAWLREQSLAPRFFCGGGWYIDEAVADALVDLGYVDCSATAFRPTYLQERARRLELSAPAWLGRENGRLLELPSTHSLGMATRAALAPLRTPFVHVYFHDTDLLDPRRRLALSFSLTILGRRLRPADLDALADEAQRTAPEVPFARCFRGAETLARTLRS